jgi:ribonucleoside-diphosphate reductase alpha chain
VDFSGVESVSSDDSRADEGSSSRVAPPRFPVRTDASRDALLTDFGKDTLNDRYLLPGESYQDLFARVASAYADDAAHAQRVYDYISRLWFMPATPVLSNGGTGRGLPISCYLNSVSDSLNGIVDTWNENVWLAARGGGIGTYWGAVRGIGEPVGLNGKTSGIIPFVRVMDSLTLAISQGSLRRGSAAVYLDVSHPEIEEFLEIRKPSGDFNRKALNLHHGVLVTDAFMEAVRDGDEWILAQPQGRLGTRQGRRALALPEAGRDPPRHRRALHHLHRQGESSMPRHQRELGLKVSTSNLCSEITLPPAGSSRQRAHRRLLPLLAQPRDLGQWNKDKAFIEDVMRFLDNVLQTISTAPPTRWRGPSTAPSASVRSALA